jgi:hypothetical protein
MTVYLPVAARRDAEQRAAERGVATGTLLRQILIGQEDTLSLNPRKSRR